MPKKKSAAQLKREARFIASYKKEQAAERARKKDLKRALGNAEWWMRKALKLTNVIGASDLANDTINLINKLKRRI